MVICHSESAQTSFHGTYYWKSDCKNIQNKILINTFEHMISTTDESLPNIEGRGIRPILPKEKTHQLRRVSTRKVYREGGFLKPVQCVGNKAKS